MALLSLIFGLVGLIGKVRVLQWGGPRRLVGRARPRLTRCVRADEAGLVAGAVRVHFLPGKRQKEQCRLQADDVQRHVSGVRHVSRCSPPWRACGVRVPRRPWHRSPAPSAPVRSTPLLFAWRDAPHDAQHAPCLVLGAAGRSRRVRATSRPDGNRRRMKGGKGRDPWLSGKRWMNSPAQHAVGGRSMSSADEHTGSRFAMMGLWMNYFRVPYDAR